MADPHVERQIGRGHSTSIRTPGVILLAGTSALLLILAIDRWLGAAPRDLLSHGLADESAHFLTAMILLAPLVSYVPATFLAGAAVGTVAIDVDHLPLILGSEVLTRETNRPLTHSLAIVVCVLTVALLGTSPWRMAGMGIAAGLMIHFWRDMATSTAGVPLLWPLDTHGFTLPYGIYVASLAVIMAFAANQARGLGR